MLVNLMGKRPHGAARAPRATRSAAQREKRTSSISEPPDGKGDPPSCQGAATHPAPLSHGCGDIKSKAPIAPRDYGVEIGGRPSFEILDRRIKQGLVVTGRKRLADGKEQITYRNFLP